ncbi:hypothetical protein P4H61_09905 [Paenibacillus peoriae]|uniref:hypothetical protein n=1 Tax=Paenibacillus peoriae TaxID=59893 RepID=UPI00026C5D07|nr:hypothetical protein [Paenibacillus peoriae]MEC0181814.1 hypothetical protein [Paenibacillus peoriae]
MKPWIVLGSSILITAAAAILLPSLHTLDSGTAAVRETQAAISTQQRVRLTDDNLVDTLKELPLTTPIASVSWEHSVLTLDVKLSKEETAPLEIYQNMAELVAFSFYGTTNVQQLLLRVVTLDKWSGERHLLLASDIRRNEWTNEALEQLRSREGAELPEQLKSRFRITVTPMWQKRFGGVYID